jgi:hypothetical protein
MEKTARVAGITNARKRAAEAVQRELGKMHPKTDELSAFSNLNPDQRERIKRNLEEKGIQPSRDNIARYYVSMLRQHQAELDKALEMQNFQCGLDIEWKRQMVYAILTNSEIRRSFPNCEKEIMETITHAVMKGELDLATFWGGFKENSTRRADEADRIAMDRIKDTMDQIRELGLRVRVAIIFADTAARCSLIGRSDSRNSEQYFEDIRKLGEERGMKVKPLSIIYDPFKEVPGVSQDNLISRYFASSALNDIMSRDARKKAEEFYVNADRKTLNYVMDAIDKYTDLDKNDTNELCRVLTNYIWTRITEAMLFDRHSKDIVFFAYGHPVYDLYPKKTIFWYSIKKGVSAQPWYIDHSKFDIMKWFGQGPE